MPMFVIASQFAVDQCTSDPCQHGGQCTPAADTYTCTCTDSYQGANCGCPSNVCLNGATCANTNGSYTCQCVAGFYGDSCELG